MTGQGRADAQMAPAGRIAARHREVDDPGSNAGGTSLGAHSRFDTHPCSGALVVQIAARHFRLDTQTATAGGVS